MNNKFILIVLLAVLLVGGGVSILIIKNQNSTSQESIDTQSESKVPNGAANKEIEGSNYKLFNKIEFEKSLTEGKVIMLYFTANWCPICREQEPINVEALFELIEEPDIIAFRVHILDSETTKETETLADNYEVRYQHTTVIIDSRGQTLETITGPISKDDLKNKLLAAK